MTAFTIRKKISFTRGPRSKKQIREGHSAPAAVRPYRVPRISRLMALALRIEELIEHGTIRDYAEAARLGHVSRARMTQIINLLNLAPDIIEEILFLPRIKKGRDPFTERDLRPITSLLNWKKQRQAWKALRVDRGFDVGVDVGLCGDKLRKGTNATNAPTNVVCQSSCQLGSSHTNARKHKS